MENGKPNRLGEIITGKICPVLVSSKYGEDKCFKESCAWWDTHYNCCAVLSSSILLEVLAKRKNMQPKIHQKSDDSKNTSQK